MTHTRPSTDGAIVWLTGLSGAGKSTIATGVYHELVSRGIRAELLDGDVMRQKISRGLGFSREDRDENIRRIGFVANLLARHGVIALVSAVSPYRAVREEIRRQTATPFVEVYVSASIEVCERRDPKGLYRKARAGELKHFTGIDDPYEPPEAPEVICFTDRQTIDESVSAVLSDLLLRIGRELLIGTIGAETEDS